MFIGYLNIIIILKKNNAPYSCYNSALTTFSENYDLLLHPNKILEKLAFSVKISGLV